MVTPLRAVAAPIWLTAAVAAPSLRWNSSPVIASTWACGTSGRVTSIAVAATVGTGPAWRA